jgi:tRNA(Arg) A34 adenosine deaminase TadA
VIARSHNLTELLNDVTAHAEMQAITAAAKFRRKYLVGCTLYVSLEPCQMCAGALYWSQISKIVFEQTMSTVVVKWEHNYIQNRRKTGCFSGRSFRLDEALFC